MVRHLTGSWKGLLYFLAACVPQKVIRKTTKVVEYFFFFLSLSWHGFLFDKRQSYAFYSICASEVCTKGINYIFPPHPPSLTHLDGPLLLLLLFVLISPSLYFFCNLIDVHNIICSHQQAEQ